MKHNENPLSICFRIWYNIYRIGMPCGFPETAPQDVRKNGMEFVMKVGLIPLGCAKNQVDSEQMLFLLRQAGHETVNDASAAEAIIVNTCGFIDSAKEESIDAIFEAVRLKKEGACRRILVTGCLAQRYGRELMEQIPEIDGLIGVERYADFPRLFEETLQGRRPFDISRGGSFACGRVLITPSFSAYVRIAEGCDNRCAYCAIPLIRGGYRSRPREDILTEMRQLASGGAREQILIAQDTSRYGRDRGEKRGLEALLREADAIPGIDFLRVLYLYPEDADEGLIDTMASLKHVCRYVDIPLQHAVPRLLKSMNRRGDIENISRVLAYARSRGFALRTTFIVGFPGETEADFLRLCDFVRETEFDRMGAFAYSAEEDTAAAGMPDQVEEEEKQQAHEKQASALSDRFRAMHEKREQERRERIAERQGISVEDVPSRPAEPSAPEPGPAPGPAAPAQAEETNEIYAILYSQPADDSGARPGPFQFTLAGGDTLDVDSVRELAPQFRVCILSGSGKSVRIKYAQVAEIARYEE